MELLWGEGVAVEHLKPVTGDESVLLQANAKLAAVLVNTRTRWSVA